MSFKSETGLQLEKWRRLQKTGLAVLLVSLVVTGGMALFLDFSGLGKPVFFILLNILFTLLAIPGLFLAGKAMFRAWNLHCPHCRKKLGYLVIDPNYSKCVFPMLRLPDFPDRIDRCPFCGFDLESEPEKHD